MMNSTNSATHNSILYKSSSNNNNNNGRRNNGTFGTDGCQVLIDGKKCGETKNLQIIREFRQLYEDKMRLIDDIAGGDSIQAKVNLQQEWIKDLTDQNEMLVKVVEELEVEAAERVTMLERKLEQSAKCACKKEDTLKERDRRIRELERQLQPYLDEDSRTQRDSQSLKEEYAELEKSMLDMRDALTAEVADKYDTIVCLRREVHLLEEQCRKSDQQTHFKDDIIKELRKELKQHKQFQLQTQSPPQKSKNRSPRKRIHQSKTDPDNTVNNHHLKDGTIVIRDSETVGDTVATQNIREKFSDPANQTIVYICESIPQRQKPNSKESSKNEIMLNDTRNCDVSMDVPKNRSPSFHVSLDRPRDLSNEVSLSSIPNTSLSTRPSIQETCVQYSRDILDMLNQSYTDKRNVNSVQESPSGYSSIKSPDLSTISILSKPEARRVVEKLEKKVEKLIQSAEMQEKLHIDETIEMIYENGSLVKATSDQSRTHTSNAVQTCRERISEKDTQTSNTCFENKEAKKTHCCKQSCAVCGNDDTTLVSLVSTDSKLNIKDTYYFDDSKDISFNKDEICAYSSPYHAEHDTSGDVLEIKKIFRGDYGLPANNKARTVYYQETPKRHVIRRNLRPPMFVINQRPKLLSPRTLHRRYNEEIVLSSKSRSVPSCAPIKLAKMRHSYPPVLRGDNYLDGYMVDRRDFDRYAVDKDIVPAGYVNCWPNRFDSSY